MLVKIQFKIEEQIKYENTGLVLNSSKHFYADSYRLLKLAKPGRFYGSEKIFPWNNINSNRVSIKKNKNRLFLYVILKNRVQVFIIFLKFFEVSGHTSQTKATVEYLSSFHIFQQV